MEVEGKRMYTEGGGDGEERAQGDSSRGMGLLLVGAGADNLIEVLL